MNVQACVLLYTNADSHGGIAAAVTSGDK